MLTIASGLLVAIVMAITMAVPAIAGISTWKIVLGLIGIAIFVRAGR